MESDSLSPAGSLADLPALVARQPGFVAVLAALARGDSGTIDGAWGSCAAAAAAALARNLDRPLLVVLPRMAGVDDFAADLAAFLEDAEGRRPLVIPAWETPPREISPTDPVFGRRLRVLEDLESDRPPHLLLACLAALMQPVPDRSIREGASRTIRVGDELDPEELMRWLIERSFERVAAIDRPGEFSMHGGILDVWPADTTDPYRIEFFGDDVESIRRFDAETQRKIEELKEVRLLVVDVGNGMWEMGCGKSQNPFPHPTSPIPHPNSLLDSLSSSAAVVLVEPTDIVDEGRHYLSRLDDTAGLFTVEETLARLTEQPSVTVSSLGVDSYETTCRLHVESVERFSSPKHALEELAAALGRDERVLLACHNEGERERLGELIAETAPGAEGPQNGQPDLQPSTLDSQPSSLNSKVSLCLGRLTKGFRLVPEQLVVLSDHELFGRVDVVRQARKPRHESRAIETFLDLNEGDLVVHLVNGIGRFRGMKILEKGEQKEEHLELEFAENVRVFVPVSLIHLVQKYVGAAKAAPPLSKLGTTTWANKKRRVADAVRDMASDMLRLHAEREAKPGIAFPSDSHYMEEFETAFPYEETPDQAVAIVAVKDDMQRPRPMDRLICGDVGYGKTEVAMRAAFKAVDAGKQVAILVPTTVLAEQHNRSFNARMAEFPIVIDGLSRFRTKGEQKKIVEKLSKGELDIVIGTHRLVSPDVTFKDLGLLVIDEEQRFGVEVKESLKKLRLEVDVLTLSATPIPRTLHMSLLGIRDISNLTTPPRDRQAIETRISRWEAPLIRHAIIRELNRGGQVYFVHNRIHDIHRIQEKIQAIVPEATIGVVHGRMGTDELEVAMTAFVRGELDVLLATTIIESGLDIPNANTIFIHQADRYGLADMHQLRGRVGRYKHRAYCYLLIEEGKPMTDQAVKRLKAIEEFSELGAGFKIAMRDLEIRGAGNILGSEQSGHITTVGYELYCQLLENAVRQLKGEPAREPLTVNVDLPVSAFFPNVYVPPGRIKIELYRRLSNVRSFEELNQFRDELRDRFGPPPAPAGRLIEVKEVQLLCRNWGIEDVRLEENRFAVFGYKDAVKIRSLAKLVGSDLRVADTKTAYYVLPDPKAKNEALLAALRGMLTGQVGKAASSGKLGKAKKVAK
ncbi:MAG: transcription-repair coupling factor [Planctomycetaceae bacterium]